MAQRFVACDREQSFLLPPDAREWLPENHPAWFVMDAVGEMNLGAFYSAYSDRRGGELPPEFSTSAGRRGWLREAKKRLEAERSADPQPVPRDRPRARQAGQAPPR